MREASWVGSGIKRCERLDSNFKVLNSGQGNPHPTLERPTCCEKHPAIAAVLQPWYLLGAAC